MYKSGEEFLDKLYKSLYSSDEVMHTASLNLSKAKNIEKYMNRLDDVNKKANTNDKKKLLYKMYHEKYVIKRENILGKSEEEKARIIEAQEKSLDKWLDYLTDDNAVYPMWSKYWVFQGMVKIGTYIEKDDTYMKRNAKTTSPFIEANPEVIAKCIGIMRDAVEGKELSDAEINKIAETGNFKKLYTMLINNYKDNENENSGFEGIWKKYNYKDRESAIKLYNSLQGYNTNWCTAGDKQTAINQLCGGNNYCGGDFYVYYTKDKIGEYRIPRVAIRMDETDSIGEIRGVADASQNLEDGFENIVEGKLKSFSFLSDKDMEYYLQVVENMKMLTKLNKKNGKKQYLTFDEEKFIFEIEKEIVGFGWQKDSRIESIRLNNLTKNKIIAVELIATGVEFNKKYISEELLNDKDVIVAAVTSNGRALEIVPDNFKNDKEVVLSALTQNGLVLESVSEELKNDKGVVIAAVTSNGCALDIVPEKLRDDKEVVLKAVAQNGLALEYASDRLKDDRDVIVAAVTSNGRALEIVLDNFKNDKEVVLSALTQNGLVLESVSEELKNDKGMVIAAVTSNGCVLEIVSEKLRDDKEVVLKAVAQNGLALEYASDRLKDDRDVVLAAIAKSKYAIKYASEELRDDEKIILPLLRENSSLLEFCSERIRANKDVVMPLVRRYFKILKYASESLKNDKKFILEAVIETDGLAFRYASDKLKNDKETIIDVVSLDVDTFRYASDKIKNDKETVIDVVSLNGNALLYVSDKLKDDKDVILAAVSNGDFCTLSCASERLKNDKELVLAAVSKDAYSLKYASKELKNDKEVALVVARKDAGAIYYVSDELKNDAEFFFEALRQNGRVLENTTEELNSDKEADLEVLRIDEILQCASLKLRSNEDFMANVRNIIESQKHSLNQERKR